MNQRRDNSTFAGAAAVALVLALMVSSCSDKSSDARPPASETTASSSTSTTSSTTTTTQPAATDEDAMPEIIDGLLQDWDAGLSAVLADPRAVAGDPDHKARTALAASFTEDSVYIADLDTLLAGYVDNGLKVRPKGSGPVQSTVYLRTLQTPDADHMSFVWCSFDDSSSIKVSDGMLNSDEVGITQGEGTAAREDGRWRLDRLSQLTHFTKPAGSPNPCPGFAKSAHGNQ